MTAHSGAACARSIADGKPVLAPNAASYPDRELPGGSSLLVKAVDELSDVGDFRSQQGVDYIESLLAQLFSRGRGVGAYRELAG